MGLPPGCTTRRAYFKQDYRLCILHVSRWSSACKKQSGRIDAISMIGLAWGCCLMNPCTGRPDGGIDAQPRQFEECQVAWRRTDQAKHRAVSKHLHDNCTIGAPPTNSPCNFGISCSISISRTPNVVHQPFAHFVTVRMRWIFPRGPRVLDALFEPQVQAR